MFGPEVMRDIQEDALNRYPEEACGAVTPDGYVPMENRAEDKKRQFNCGVDIAALQLSGELLAVVHSHPDTFEGPSSGDMIAQQAMGVTWGIVWTDGRRVGVPYFWGDAVPIPPLEGRDFRHGPSGSDNRGDCMALIRDYYKLEMGIDLPDPPRDDVWWKRKHPTMSNLYLDNYEKWGFRLIRDDEIRPGDVFFASIASGGIPNHGGIYLGDQLILHHLGNQLSRKAPIINWTKHISHWLRYDAG